MYCVYMQAHLYATHASRHADIYECMQQIKQCGSSHQLGKEHHLPFSIFTILTVVREREQRVDKVVVNSKGDANCNQPNSSIF